jgi:hypothetical protein
MKHSLLSALMFISLLGSWNTFGQNISSEVLDGYFGSSPEIYFTFRITDRSELESLTRIISIDDVKAQDVYAYANRKEFARFLELDYSFTLLPHPGIVDDSTLMSPSAAGDGTLTNWDFYPTYEQYIDFMTGFAASNPSICKLVPIGASIQGRQLLAVKISDNVNEEEAEPQILYTSSIHGDETTGYVLMLHLIDFLLQNYAMNPRIQEMINSTEIFINPLANPDGTYHGGNHTVNGSIRYNANNVDLNRNYPDPEDGPHPDGNPWQVETMAFMDFADSNYFVISANFHGGAEVFNYPWDTWAKLAADDDWWQFVGREYVDTVYVYSPPSYFSGFNNGITNGYQWYTISGGRQDYMNYFHYCREVTLEISDVKLLPASQLINHWNYNYRSLLNYIDEANYGVQGIITDSVTGDPLRAKVFIPGHDIDNSFVFSKLPTGYYSRLLYQGTYTLNFSRVGYVSKNIEVDVTNRTTVPLNIELVPLNMSNGNAVIRVAMLFPNPAQSVVRCEVASDGKDPAEISCFSTEGKCMFTRSVLPEDGMICVDLDIHNLPKGLYVIKVETGKTIFTERLMVN